MMYHRPRHAGFLLFVALLCLAAEQAAVPTTDDVKAALDRKDYSTTVKLASRLLGLHGNAAAGLNRYELFTLKGEGHFGLHAVPMAIEAYNYALKETTDPHEIAEAKATILLFKRASGSNYVPKTTPPGGTKPPPIDLLDRTQRKAAFAALLDDELTPIQPKIKSASSASSLTVIFPVLQQVEDLVALDRLANDNDDKTKQISGDLVEHARTLITTALKGMWSRVDDIDKAANTKTTTSIQVPVTTSGLYVTKQTVHKAGLSQSNKSELQNIISTCDKIQPAAQAFMQSAGNEDKDWAAITADATRVGSRAKDVLNADYTDTYSQDNTNSTMTGQPSPYTTPQPYTTPRTTPATPKR
jgi:hypothetical protein